MTDVSARCLISYGNSFWHSTYLTLTDLLLLTTTIPLFPHNLLCSTNPGADWNGIQLSITPCSLAQPELRSLGPNRVSGGRV
jgi:hypothetical protein